MTEQSDQSDQPDHVPFTGQQPGEQDWVSYLGPSHKPPQECPVHSLLLFCMPFPHKTEHSDHAVQPLHVPLVGQQFTLQAIVCWSGPVHVPPHEAPTQRRYLVMLPPPHETEQSLHCDHVLKVPFTRQQPMSQDCVSTLAPSQTPQLHSRVLFWVPKPQDTEH